MYIYIYILGQSCSMLRLQLKRLMQTQLMQFFEILSLPILQILQVLFLAETVLFLEDASPPSLGPPNG